MGELGCEDLGGFLDLSDEAGRLADILLRCQLLLAERVVGGRLDGEAPEELDVPEVGILVQKRSPVANERGDSGIPVSPLCGDFIAFADANVLIEVSAIGKALEGSVDPGDGVVDREVGETLVIDTGEGKQAAIAAGFEGEGGIGDEAGEGYDASPRLVLTEPLGGRHSHSVRGSWGRA